VAGAVAGFALFAAMVAFGALVSSRVDNVLPVIILAVAGAYGGWLLGVIVFGAVRGGGAPDGTR
jgi:hypothetical protein